MSETEGFTIRTALMEPGRRTDLIRAAVDAVRAETAALRCGLPPASAAGYDAGVGAAVTLLTTTVEADDSEPDRPRTRLVARPSREVVDAVATVAPVALDATLWDEDANLVLDVIDGDRLWIRLTAEEIEALVAPFSDLKVIPDGDWVPGTNSRAKRAWGRRTTSRFRR